MKTLKFKSFDIFALWHHFLYFGAHSGLKYRFDCMASSGTAAQVRQVGGGKTSLGQQATSSSKASQAQQAARGEQTSGNAKGGTQLIH